MVLVRIGNINEDGSRTDGDTHYSLLGKVAKTSGVAVQLLIKPIKMHETPAQRDDNGCENHALFDNNGYTIRLPRESCQLIQALQSASSNQ